LLATANIDTAGHFFVDTFGEHVALGSDGSVETTRFFAPRAASYAFREAKGF
jgi:hypothetical protein